MTVRQILEKAEYSYLSPYAAKSSLSRGRERPISPDDTRTEFQRDRDRVIHSKAFRRLQFKTQVFLSPEGDHYRTRLTHTLEVTQVARTIARGLRLNEDLTEAIALSHDLGHTPFGHIGERTLTDLVPGGFRHNEQSLRVVDKLEGKGGLNLTHEVRDGILNHPGSLQSATLEGRIVAKSDRIAYINHDIDDAMRAGILKEGDLPKDALAVLGNTHGERINTMITDIIRHSQDQPAIMASPEVQEATDRMRAFLFQNVYQDSWRREEERKCDFIIKQLFEYFVGKPELMPEDFRTIAVEEGTARAVTDFIASMTDRYALRLMRSIFIPEAFSIL
ncbi:MAG TPA: deoxyguanosinetriphosphate triphosphohydrolase [Candidatus Limnocylindria bacterium]|nr:deoxyguanosinetriphosphate triphosphohydrolase [Candidatus Limnocylindria bacterium]